MPELDEASASQLQAAMMAGDLTSRDLTAFYLARIEALNLQGPALRAVLETNPAAIEIAAGLDRERREGRIRGPLHGIPVLLKDNIDTADGMMTSAGSLALIGTPPTLDATVAARLRAAGAVLLGKTNLSEWANCRSRPSSSGWCGRNGQARNPYVLDRNPGGSSSGSAIAVAAGLCAASIGTETDGSIVSPAGSCGVVGIKPTVGLVSRAGVVPISHTQDTAGPLARSVADAATLLTAIVAENPDRRDHATRAGAPVDFTRFLVPDGLVDARIGIPRNLGFGASPRADAIVDEAIRAMRAAGAEIVDPVRLSPDQERANKAEMTVLQYEFKHNLNAYLSSRRQIALDREGFPLTLAGLIAFNEAHADEELRLFGQEIFLDAEAKGPLSDAAYREALAESFTLSGPEGIDRLLTAHRLDALVVPTNAPAWLIDPINGDASVIDTAGPAARAGYPQVSLPAGFVCGLPVNITFVGGSFSEPALIRIAYAFEHLTQARRPPRFLPTVADALLDRR